jgi:hypothetical protein
MSSGLYKQPIGDGYQWVMKWEDYIKHGFKEELATKEVLPPRQKLAYMDRMRQNEILKEKNEQYKTNK